MDGLDWRRIGPLAGLGLLVGVLSLFGLWPFWAEFLIWLAVGATWVVVLHFQIHRRFFWHGATTAFIGGFAAILTQVIFIETYLRNNPSVGEQFAQTSTGAARGLFLVTGLVFTILLAAVTGAAVWLTIPKESRETARAKD